MYKSHIAKAKTIRGERWVNGYLFVRPILDRYFVICGEEQWEVDKDTICDDTGITDFKNHPIFTGDILKVVVRDWKKNTEECNPFEDFVWDDSKKKNIGLLSIKFSQVIWDLWFMEEIEDGILT